METEEVIKLVDGIYKNILEKFNPGARQLISAGKAYLKALHGAAAASRLFNEALAKIAVNAQQGGTTDIGSALMSIVGVYKEIQDQHMNILKAFYVDLLVPLETNLEKDTKVVQFEQKKFLQQHKLRADSYSKAAATMKKHRKKKTNPQSAEKEIKSMQLMEEEKNKLDGFVEQSLKNAMTQERRRYGFVLERQCSLAKHWIAYHTAGKKEIEGSLDGWNEISSSREFLPPNVESMFKRKIKDHISDDDDASSIDSDRGSISSQLRKTRSIDASIMDMRSMGDVINNNSMNRAKSEYNLTTNTNLITTNHNHNHNVNRQHHHNTIQTPVSTQIHNNDVNHWDQRPLARALYAYLSSGENQLSFLEGDRIALVGERAKGWQFGENLRTQMFGWFPLAYTETDHLDDIPTNNWESMKTAQNHHSQHHGSQHQDHSLNTPDSSLESTLVDELSTSTSNHHKSLTNSYHEDISPSRMFGDTIMYRQSKQFTRVAGGGIGPKPGPPPTLPAPVPQPVVPPYAKNHQLSSSHSFSSSGGPPVLEKRRAGPATMNLSKPSVGKMKQGRDVVTNASLHSSNDSGFANEPPPQPEVDYSDEETVTRVPIRSSRLEKLNYNRARQSQQIQSSPIQKQQSQQSQQHNSQQNLSQPQQQHHQQHQNNNANHLRRSNDDTSELITLRKPKSTNSTEIRQSSSFGNLADENTIDFMYRTSERRSRSNNNNNKNQNSNSNSGTRERNENNAKANLNSNNVSNNDDHNINDDLISSNGNLIKRTKSFWKFGKSDDDILEGMALWKHRDLVQTENEKNLEKKKEATLKRSNRNSNSNSNNNNRLSNEQAQQNINLSHSNSTSSSETLKNGINNNNSNSNNSNNIMSNKASSNNINSNSIDIEQIAIIKYPLTKSDIDNRISKHNEDNIYGVVERRNHQNTNNNNNNINGNNNTNPKPLSRHTYNDQDNMIMDDDDELMLIKETKTTTINRRSINNGNKNNIITTNNNNTTNINNNIDHKNEKYRNSHHNDYYDETPDDRDQDDRESNFYDDESGDDMMLMKTVKRKEILKQYYSSGTDTEHNSSSSDPYDCIVVDDHLVRKNKTNNNQITMEKLEFTTFRGELKENHHIINNNENMKTTSGTLLPRTKLSKVPSAPADKDGHNEGQVNPKLTTDTQKRKSRSSSNNNNNNSNNNNNNLSSNKSYGPWYDLWGNDVPVKNK